MKKCFAFLLGLMLAMTITPVSAANGPENPNPPDPNDATTATADVLNKRQVRNPAELAANLGSGAFDGSCDMLWGVVTNNVGSTHQSKSFALQYLEAEGLKAIREQFESGNAVIVKGHRVKHGTGLSDTHSIVCNGYETYLEKGKDIYDHYITKSGSLPYGTMEEFMVDWYIEAILVYY